MAKTNGPAAEEPKTPEPTREDRTSEEDENQSSIPLGITDALRYLISRITPERHRSKVALLVALTVVLIGLGGFLHFYWWWIAGIPPLKISIFNVNLEKGGEIPVYGKTEIDLGTGENLPDTYCRIVVTEPAVAENGGFVLQAQEKCELWFELPKDKELYKHYKGPSADISLRLYRDEHCEHLEWDLGKIPFSPERIKDIVREVILRDRDEDPSFQESGIHMCFSIDPNADPDKRRILEVAKRSLEQAHTHGFFWLVPHEKYQEEKRFVEKMEREDKVVVASARPADPFPRNRARLILAETALVDHRSTPDGSTWTFDVHDVENRMEDGLITVNGTSLRLTAQDLTRICRRLQRQVVLHYGIEGCIREMIDRGDHWEAVLNVGSYMGVVRGMEFKVLKEGTENVYCGSVTIDPDQEVPLGTSGARGPFTCETPVESNYEDFEGYRVKVERRL